MSSTYRDKNNPFSRCTNKHSQLVTFSQPCCNRIFSNSLSHKSTAKVWPYRFRSRGTTGSSILDHDFDHLCRVRRIQMSGHSDFGILNNLWASSIFTWVSADTASAACPSQPGNLEMISMILAAVIWNADDPCSVNTLIRSRIIFYNITSEYNSTFVFLVLCLQFGIFKWQMSISEAKWTFAPFVLASSITSDLLLTVVRSHAGIFSSFSHSLSTAAFAASIFMAWGTGINLCTK